MEETRQIVNRNPIVLECRTRCTRPYILQQSLPVIIRRYELSIARNTYCYNLQKAVLTVLIFYTFDKWVVSSLTCYRQNVREVS